MIKDSGNRTKFESGAVRDIQEGKGRCDLLPLSVVGCWCEDSAYGILGCIDLYRLQPSTEKMSAILNKFASKHRNTVDTCKGLERYRWELVLEVAKHFEDGAKKYGDRNWEKGIPCNRYIDSAVRHYCKWSAGWDDEPHDRAFIWNILCCEWTRLRYGWNLERLDEAKKYGDDLDSSIRGFLDKMTDYDWDDPAKRVNRYFSYSFNPDNKSDVKATPGAYNDIRLNDPTFAEVTGTIKCDLCELHKLLGIKFEEVKEKDRETEDLKAACDVVKQYNTCLNENCIDRSCSECKYYTDPDTVQKAVDILLDHAEKSLNGGEKVSNRYIRNVAGGVELCDDACAFVGYVHGFKGVKSEADIRSIVEKSWGLLTLNPFTLEKIIEDHGYIADIHFIIEMYKNPGDIKLPDDWQLVKRKAKEE